MRHSLEAGQFWNRCSLPLLFILQRSKSLFRSTGSSNMRGMIQKTLEIAVTEAFVLWQCAEICNVSYIIELIWKEIVVQKSRKKYREEFGQHHRDTGQDFLIKKIHVNNKRSIQLVLYFILIINWLFIFNIEYIAKSVGTLIFTSTWSLVTSHS